MTDARARRVYAWEDRVVAPLDRSEVPFAQMQSLVDHVWASEGLRWPPRVRHRRATRATIATGSRLAIEAPDTLPSWVLLHEMAHALTDPGDGTPHAGHGPDFLGLYVKLLVRHARLDQAMLAESLKAAGLSWNPQARPVLAGD
ncbi:hypothetical protein ACLF3G_18065 [Falsiroseomonas sp. HC035]|uniref:hypothetical protein n=1 Tax=Falsiroseomonas sp. HC035 TaxID=3390999 RepID=UPI003D3145A7